MQIMSIPAGSAEFCCRNGAMMNSTSIDFAIVEPITCVLCWLWCCQAAHNLCLGVSISCHNSLDRKIAQRPTSGRMSLLNDAEHFIAANCCGVHIYKSVLKALLLLLWIPCTVRCTKGLCALRESWYWSTVWCMQQTVPDFGSAGWTSKSQKFHIYNLDFRWF